MELAHGDATALLRCVRRGLDQTVMTSIATYQIRTEWRRKTVQVVSLSILILCALDPFPLPWLGPNITSRAQVSMAFFPVTFDTIHQLS
jgi:hypothetical protein